MLKVPYILGVLPTSIGKSLSYLLTSSLSISKVTIIILPLVGLKLDILRRASKFNIPCSNFEETREFKNITLISIETIVEDSFISLVQALINNNSLDRIVFNKCYLLISSSSYRSIMFRFKDLLLLPVQFVFLTGTLPLSFEDEIRSSLSLDDLTIIRASCSKSNISYKVSAYKSNIEKNKIQQISNYIFDFQRKKFLTKDDKILVFCPSEANTILVANSLNCSRFYSSLSNKNKSNTLKRFLTSKDPYYSILACTSALQEGFDYSSIRLVVYKDIAYSFLGFLQGSSRGGRDNRPSKSIFFYNSSNSRLLSTTSSSSTILEIDSSLVFTYLRETTCRRRQINLYLNSELVDECSNLEARCNLCLSRATTYNNQVNRIRSITKVVEEKRAEARIVI